ncbi:uncharacterized protein LOC128882058 [Hylaeus volcanicus]|uniref:uncharacterized protein LOC128882058 n=1 Tax=Hylaeus volcanicus TaxID=313075 RepID=UPI0023B85FEE|nr:uncharacterized protein LOC128882058 [Hylaeus volcanicus]
MSNMRIQLMTYFNKKIVSNLLMPHILSVNTRVNASTKSKTHYDTLNVSPNATHNEIKSSYFKLTVKYHPDKNKSASAKVLFQEVSEAYEVLSNHKLRKLYDRTMATRSSRVNQMQKPTPTYDCSDTTRHKRYDFDEWTRAHYHNAFEESRKRKAIYEEYMQNKRRMKEAEEIDPIFAISTVVSLTILAFILLTVYTSNDNVVKKVD